MDSIDLGIFFLEKSLFKVFGRIKLHNKGSKTYFFTQESYSDLRSICWYCVSSEQYLT